jgi:hypothetical protein
MVTWIKNGMGIAIGFILVSLLCSGCLFLLTLFGMAIPFAGT